MVKRGLVIKKINNNTSSLGIFWWIYKILHRYLFLYYIFALIFGLIGFWYSSNLSIILISVLAIEILFVSIAIHETGHYSFARFLYLETTSVSIIPHKFEIYINFLKNNSLNEEDFGAILLSGPVNSIIFMIIPFTIFFIFRKILYPVTNILYLIMAIIVCFNLMSLLPFKESDGGRAYKIIKKHKGSLKRIVCLFLFYISVLAKVNSSESLKELRDSAMNGNLKKD